MVNPTFRYAERKDMPLIMRFVLGLARYEHLEDQVVATPKTMEYWIFDQKKAEVLFVMEEGKEVGFVLFFHNFSTFVGRAGIYLEDLFVEPSYRGRGYGRALMEKLASIAVERGCGRFEWAVLNWNEPSSRFYKSLGAAPLSEWTVYRVAGEALQKLAGK